MRDPQRALYRLNKPLDFDGLLREIGEPAATTA